MTGIRADCSIRPQAQKAPCYRNSATYNHAAKLRHCVLALLLGATLGHSQWLEKTLYLPDSLCGVTAPSLVVHNSVNNKVYVTGKYGGFVRNGRDCWIVVLDGATNQRIARIAVPSEVGFLAYNATDNKIYAASFVDSSLTVIDGASDTVLRQLWLRSKVMGLYWESTVDKLYCGHARDSSVTVLDAVADTVVARVHTVCQPSVFQASSELGKLYCGESNSRYLTVIDCAADTIIKALYLDYNTVAMCYDSARQRIFSADRRYLSVVDAAADSAVFSGQVTAGFTRDLALGDSGAKLYCDIGDSLVVLDATTLAWLVDIKIGRSPSVVRYDPLTNRVFSADGRDGHVFVVDCASDSVTAVLHTGIAPRALCFNMDASKAWSANNGSDDVTVVDCVGDTVVATVFVGSHPTSLSYNRTFGKLYCADSTNGLVSVISGQTNRIVKNVWVGYHMTGICVGDSGAKVYCRVRPDSIVVAIDCATDSVVARIRVDMVPELLLYVPERNRLYCGGLPGGQGTAAVIDCATDSVIATVGLQNPPVAFCYNSVGDKLICGAGEFDDVEVVSCSGDSSLGFVAGVRAQGPTLYSASYDKLYLSCLNRLYLVDGTADTLLATKTAVNGNVEGSMCLNTLQHKVYAPFQAGINGSILIVDAASDSLLKTMAAESSYSVCYDSINNTVYVSDGGNFGAVKIIDCISDLVTARIPVGLRPTALAWNPDQNRTYVINSWSGSISVLRDSFPSGIGAGAVPPTKSKPLATVVRSVLILPERVSGKRSAGSAQLLDITGRNVLELKPGANDVRSLAPGVYFVRATSCELLAASCHKVVIAR